MTHSWDPSDVLPGDLTGVLDLTGIADGDALVWDATAGLFVPGTVAVTEEAVRDAGRWEVVVSGVPAEAVTNEAGDDWLYYWVGA